MTDLWLGIVVSGDSTSCVLTDCGQEPMKLKSQFKWSLQDGDTADAYARFFERTRDYIREKCIRNTVIKASAIGQRVTLSHLQSAELRGVVAAAAKLGGSQVYMLQKAVISRTFGDRKADEYIKDDGFWNDQIEGDLDKTRREAALLILSQRRA